MSSHLIIGGYGLIGSAVRADLDDRGLSWLATTRRNDAPRPTEWIAYDLLRSDPKTLPPADVVYLIAAHTTFMACEGKPESWLANVDAQIAIARQFTPNSFIVFISSDAVEWCGGTAYARQKSQTESYIQSINGAIMRPTRILPRRVAEFAKYMVDTGILRVPGVYRWE